MVAAAGVGREIVEDRLWNCADASALFEAKTLTLVLVVTRLDVCVLCVMLGMYIK